MSKFQKRVSVLAVTIAAILLLMICARSKPVRVRLTEAEEHYTEWDFTIFNPFRDTTPEQCAVPLLESLKGGRCSDLLTALPDGPDYRQRICEKEAKYPLVSWKLRNRTDRAR